MGKKKQSTALTNDERRKRGDIRMAALICAVLATITLAVYWQVTHFELLTFDDDTYVSENEFVRQGLTADGAGEAFRFDAYSGNWHPVTWLSLMLDSTIYGPVTPTGTGMTHHLGPLTFEAEGYHLTNLLLHVTNTLLLFLFASWLTGSIWRAGFVAGLFALHPLHVESVAWVAERKDVLSTFFWLLTTLAYMWYAKRKSALKYALLVSLFALGLMAKPMLVTLPLVLLFLDFWPLKRFVTTSAETRSYLPLLEKIPLFMMSLAVCLVTVAVQRKGGALTTVGITLPMRLATACVACATYLIKMVWPYHLAPMYPYPVSQSPLTGVVYMISPVVVIASALALLAVTGAAIAFRRKAPYFAFGWFWYLVTLVPVLGLIQVGYQCWADRYTYVPLIGIFIILACGISEWLLKKPNRARSGSLATIAVIILCTCAYLTYRQAGWWHDSKKLYYRTLDVTSHNWFIRNALGRLFLKEDEQTIGAEGPSPRAYRITREAVDQLEQAVEIDNGIGDIHNNLGVAYRALSLFPTFGEVPAKRLEEATNQFKEALVMDPKLDDASLNLGMTLSQLGKEDDAIAVYNQVLQRPEVIPSVAYWARINLSALLLDQGRKDESIALLEEAVDIDAKKGTDPGHQARQRLQQLGAPRQ